MAQTDRGEQKEPSEEAKVESVLTPPVETVVKDRPRSYWRFVKGAISVVSVFVCLVVGTALGYLHQTSDVFRVWLHETRTHPVTVVKHLNDPLAAFRPELQLPVQNQHRVNILLVGADSDYEGARPVVLKNTHGRSDALMVVQVDFDKHNLAVLSIPRDTAVVIPHYDGRVHKINAAHAYGGPKLTQQTVESVFGIHTDYYVSLNFDAFQKVVDAVDGVDITVAKALDYDDNYGKLHIHLKPGFQHLNGYQAMGYVRIRHSDDDIHRAERQHEFMEAMRAKITHADTFMKLPEVLNQITQNVDSDLNPAQQLTIANFARGVSKDNFQVATLPSTTGRSFVYANAMESEKLISKMFFEGNPQAVKVTAVMPPSHAAHRTLLARANRTEHRRHRRRHALPILSKATI